VTKTQKFLSRSALSTGVIGLALLASPAFAQDAADTAAAEAPDDAGTIVVTGTLIKNPNITSSAPVSVVGSNEIELRQSNVAEEILRDLPGAVPSIGSAVNNGNNGASFVNLRGLGSARNIVLLDGNRIVPGDLVGRVDLNNIPLALVERVDVLTGGASTTYGADAVGGVVNFITKTDFSGVEITGSNQITQEGDGNIFRVDVTIGGNFDDGRGNAVFSVGYQQADPVYQGARPYSVDTLDSYSGDFVGSGTAVPSRFTLAGTTQQIDPATGALVDPYSTFNFNPYNIFQTPFERFNMFGSARYEIADGIEAYTRGLFSKNTVSTIIAPSGIFNSSVTIPYSNPYLPAAARAQFCAANGLTTAQCDAAALATDPSSPDYATFDTNVLRRSTEVGPRISDFVTTIFDYRAGIRGSITDTINFDVSGSYGESENTQTQQGYVLTSRVRDALLATNTTSCLSGNEGCVPVNLFGPDGSITADQIPYLTSNATTSLRTTLAQARALINGDFGYALPWAEDAINFAVGVEYREYHAKQESDLLSQTPGELGGAGGAAPNIDGGYNVYEAYGELVAPLVQDKPFAQLLQIAGGIRYSHYSVDTPESPTFNTTTWKVEGQWKPIDDITFRGNFQRAVRAPNIGELFTPVTTGLTNLGVDPCVGAAPVNNADLRAVCLAQGAPASSIGNITVPSANQVNLTTGGNLDLKPEKANTWTVGAVLQPTFLPGFTATIDYYHIKIKDAITTPTPDDLVSSCFDNITSASATDPACLAFGRNPATGGLDGDPATTLGLIAQLSNLGTLETDGIDLTMNYRHEFDFATLNLSFNGNWTNSSKFKATPVSVNRDCVGYYSVNCASIQPKFSWNTRATLSFEDIDVSLLWRHIDSEKFEPLQIEADGGPDETVLEEYRKIKAYNYFDLASRFALSDNFDLTLTVQNLFNKKPPVVGNTIGSTTFNSGNTYPATYDALGRRFAVSGRLRF